MASKDPIALIEALDNPNVRAFLRMLRHGEGTAGDDGYRTQFGGGLFDSFADHPRKPITRKLGGTPITSTAAGAYQFLARTWDGLVQQYGFADFGPKNQDLGAVALILGRKALHDVIAGRFEDAVRKCNREWASLPGSPYGQPVVTMARARKEYEAHGGMYAAVAPAVHEPLPTITDIINPEAIAADTITPTPKEQTMAPFVTAVLPSLIDLVPKLGRLFSSGSETSERNVQAAEIVVAAAKDAIGARNEQELLEVIKADPAAAAAVRSAIESQWFKLEEVGGGVQAARVADAQFSAGNARAWHSPSLWIALAMLPMVYAVVGSVVGWWGTPFSEDVRSAIANGVIGVVMGGLMGYYFGQTTSRNRAPGTPER